MQLVEYPLHLKTSRPGNLLSLMSRLTTSETGRYVHLANEMLTATVFPVATTDELCMTRKDLVARCGYVGFVIAAFALLIGIIASPVFERSWVSPITASVNTNGQIERLPAPGRTASTERRG